MIPGNQTLRKQQTGFDPNEATKGERAGTDGNYSRITQDGNNRYEYDTEGNVSRKSNFETTLRAPLETENESLFSWCDNYVKASLNN